MRVSRSAPYDVQIATTGGAHRTETPQTLERRRLRYALRRLRDGAGLTQEQVAAEMDWSLSKVIRIEAGSVSISINDLRAMLALYRVTDADTVGELAALARASRRRRWWSRYGSSLPPQLASYIGLEAEACGIRFFQPLAVPGLLQTEAYARAVIVGTSPERLPESTVDTRVEVRLRRQDEVLGRPEPPEILAVLDEAVLRRTVGGPAVMRAQLAHLRELGSRPHVTIHVLPLSAGATPGLNGSFLILEFPGAADSDIVYVETPPGELWLDKPADVALYRRAFDELRALARDTEQSAALIDGAADELRRQPSGRKA
jgi:transcriptional regulator with XRE-family HTH domain